MTIIYFEYDNLMRPAYRDDTAGFMSVYLFGMMCGQAVVGCHLRNIIQKISGNLCDVVSLCQKGIFCVSLFHFALCELRMFDWTQKSETEYQ